MNIVVVVLYLSFFFLLFWCVTLCLTLGDMNAICNFSRILYTISLPLAHIFCVVVLYASFGKIFYTVIQKFMCEL